MKGLTVSVDNTDAEGRLVMGDVMTYVQREFKPKQMLDLATLTGAAMVAIGVTHGCLFSNDDSLKDAIIKAGKDGSEPMWHMPLNNEHRNKMKRTASDLGNHGGSWGGACTAAAFLENFVEEGVKWAVNRWIHGRDFLGHYFAGRLK